MPENKKCQFKTDWLPTYECPERALEDSEKGYCIFHKPNKTDDEAKLFEKAIKKKLQNKDYVFIGYHFPAGTTFRNHKFEENADFWGSSFEGYADFRETTYKKYANFRGTTFNGDALFPWSSFQENADFWASTFGQKADFRQSTSRGHADFRESIFKGDALFSQSSFAENAHFSKSTFEGHTDFWGTTFKAYADFRETTFRGDAFLPRSTFKGDADFSRSTFWGEVDFRESAFKGITKFGDIVFKTTAEFTGVAFRDNVSAEQIFRTLKIFHQRRGDYVLAGEYYYKERIARRKQFPFYSPTRWFEYVFLDGICGYGERPWRVIGVILCVILGLAFLYWKVGHIFPSPELLTHPHRVTFLDSLYFSIATFTTLGFGGWQPDPIHWIRYIVALEAFGGFFLIILFVITFFRRMTR